MTHIWSKCFWKLRTSCVIFFSSFPSTMFCCFFVWAGNIMIEIVIFFCCETFVVIFILHHLVYDVCLYGNKLIAWSNIFIGVWYLSISWLIKRSTGNSSFQIEWKMRSIQPSLITSFFNITSFLFTLFLIFLCSGIFSPSYTLFDFYVWM